MMNGVVRGSEGRVNGSIHKLSCVFLSPFAMCDDDGVPPMAIAFASGRGRDLGQ